MSVDENRVIYPELSYKLVGLAFKVFNDVGYGHSEKHYQKILESLLETNKLPFERELLARQLYNGKEIGKYYFDFLIDDKIILELKVRPSLGYTHIKQVVDYLKTSNYKLAILIYFTRDGVKYRRVLNGN